MNETVAKRLRKIAGVKNINQERDDVTYQLREYQRVNRIGQIFFVATRRIKDEALQTYKRAKQMYKDPDMRRYIT